MDQAKFVGAGSADPDFKVKILMTANIISFIACLSNQLYLRKQKRHNTAFRFSLELPEAIPSRTTAA